MLRRGRRDRRRLLPRSFSAGLGTGESRGRTAQEFGCASTADALSREGETVPKQTTRAGRQAFCCTGGSSDPPARSTCGPSMTGRDSPAFARSCTLSERATLKVSSCRRTGQIAARGLTSPLPLPKASALSGRGPLAATQSSEGSGRIARKRTFDRLVTLGGVVVMVVLTAAASFLAWVGSYLSTRIHNQLAAQEIFSPAKGSSALAGPKIGPRLDQHAGLQLIDGSRPMPGLTTASASVGPRSTTDSPPRRRARKNELT